MPDAAPPTWTLISVLFASQPLTPSLAAMLCEAAYQLYRKDEGEAALTGALVRGTVVNLKKSLLIGQVGGPAFEAHFETERGAGNVRFLLTERGIEYIARGQSPASLN